MTQSVVHIVHGFHIGGLEKLIVNCINKMGEQYQHTIISLTTIGDDIVQQLQYPVTMITLHKPAGNSVRLYPTIYRHLRQIQPDIVQTYNLATIEYQCVAAAARVSVRIHAEHGRDTYDPFGKVKKYRYLRRLCACLIHRMVAVSDDLYQWLANDVGIPKKKLLLIRNGINTDHFQPAMPLSFVKPDPDAEPDYDDIPRTEENNVVSFPPTFTFGHVARLQSVKNQQLLIGAYQEACRQSPTFAQDTQLVLVGDGDQRPALEQLVVQSPPGTHIHFAGSQTDMRAQYARFDAFVLSSIAEGIPLTLLESMSMGIPHIVTNVGGIGEVIIEGCTGIGVPSENQAALTTALLEFYHQKNQLPDMGASARHRIEQDFSEHNMVEAYKSLYRA
ncbi:glycosyltransferase [Photobacterium japonica]|uniref:glycosyltransferase n=1 Tax=Photobacterium japonica TaxID=2910235 RepID=UPI003D0CC044